MLFVRRAAALVLTLFALLCVVLAAALPFQLTDQAARDRSYYGQLRRAAYVADQFHQIHRRFPTAAEAPDLVVEQGLPVQVVEGKNEETECEAPFHSLPTDRVVVSFWRGEWFECLAYPSGRTTLPRSVGAYIFGGLWSLLAFLGLAAVATALTARWLWIGRVTLRRRASARLTDPVRPT